MPLDKSSREQIARIQKRYHAHLERIRQDRRLSQTGKNRAVAKLYLDTKRQADTLRAEGERGYRTRVTELERALFGIGATRDPLAAISYRDAQSTAAELNTPGKADAVMRRALRSGDTLLAKAVFAHCFDQIEADKLREDEWGKLVNAYLAEHEDVRASALELGQLRDANGKRARFEEAVSYGIIRPGEVEGYSDATLAEWVQQDIAEQGDDAA